MAIQLLPLAAGRVIGGTGVGTGIAGAASARTGAGVYTLTMDQQVDSTQCVMLGMLEVNTGTIAMAHTSDSVKGVTTTAVDGTTATDKTFDFAIWQILGI